MRPTIPALELQRGIRTMAVQLTRNEVSAEYARGYLDALLALSSLAGLHDGYLQRATVAPAELCTLQPAGCEIAVRP